MNDRIFGIPFFTCKIDPRKYDKEKLVNGIESNYLKNPDRIEWAAQESTQLMSYNNDWNNDDIKLDFTDLKKVYQDIIPQCLNGFNLQHPYRWTFSFASYTCMNEGGYMRPHNHPDLDFVAVHYLKFDSEIHTSTRCINENPWANYTTYLRPELIDILGGNITNSWASSDWFLPTEEDTLCITPGFLYHEVPPQQKSDKLRMTLVTAIRLSK